MQTKFLSIRDICYIAIFTAVIAALSPLSIPMPYVSITLSSFVIPFSAVVLGAKRGTIATIAYLLLGAMGMPIFSNFGGGLGMLFGPTGGFLFAFPLYAFFAGWGADRNHWIWLTAGLLFGVALLYLGGILQWCLVTGNSPAIAFTWVVPLLPTEALKVVLAGVLGRKVRSVLARHTLPES
ncbi:MAG: biotin transporter BioY [Oscillospiraceae bacterium]|nr:biotin transporter BioY [Oscillospiraceae bacterium]